MAPPLAAPLDHRRRGRVLASLARDRDHLDVLDLLPALHDSARHGSLYHRRSEHLNSRGGFFVQRALLKHAGLAHRGLRPLSLERAAYIPALSTAPTGLSELPSVALVNRDLVPCELGPATEKLADEPDATKLRAEQMRRRRTCRSRARPPRASTSSAMRPICRASSCSATRLSSR